MSNVDIKNSIQQSLIQDNEFEVVLPSTGVLPQTSLFNETVKQMLVDCFNNETFFTEDEISNLKDINLKINGR